MKILLALSAVAVVAAGVSSTRPIPKSLDHAVAAPVASAHIVMLPPPDYFGSMLVAR